MILPLTMIIIGKCLLKKFYFIWLGLNIFRVCFFKGSINIDQCSINYLIPVWLIVSGSGAISIEILISLFIGYTILRFFVNKTSCERICIILLVILPIIIIFLFNIAWFFAGKLISSSFKIKIKNKQIHV